MKMSHIALLGLMGVFGATACASNDPTDLPPGTYESTTKTKSESGTVVKEKTTTNVTQDQYGNKRAVVRSKESTDPRGLFNKSTSTTEHVYEER